MRKVRLVVPMLAVLAVVAGCSPTVVAEPSETTTPIESSTPTPTPSRPALAQLTLTPGSLGTLVLGSSLPDTNQTSTSMVAWVDNLCVSPAYHIAAGDPRAGGWLPDPSYDVSGRHGFEVYAPDGSLQRIDVTVAGIATEAGVRVGDPETAVQAAYPNARVHEFAPIYRLHDVTAANGTLGMVVDLRTGTVAVLRATVPSADTVEIAGGGTSINGCSYLLP